MATLEQKIRISLGSAALFALINLPQTYKLTNKLLGVDLYNSSTNCPTNSGLILHSLVFFALTYLSMGNSSADDGIKLKHTIYATLIFYFLSSPAMFSFVGSILGSQVADSNGCPTTFWVLLHAAVYCAALVGVMYLPDRCG